MSLIDVHEMGEYINIHFVVTDPVTPVVRSQVFDTVYELRKIGVKADVILLLQTRHFIDALKRRRSDKLLFGSIVTIRFIPFQNSFIVKFIGGLILAWSAYRKRASKSISIFHCRGLRSTLFANIASRVVGDSRVIFDVRGDYLAEEEYSSGQSAHLECVQKLERDCIRKSDHTLYVSEYLRKTVIGRYGLGSDNSSVMYCTAVRERFNCEEADRTAMRQRLGITNKLVFIYSGSVGKWHCFGTVIKVCEILAEIYKNAYFLLLINQPEAARSNVGQSKIAACSDILSVGADEICSYLSAADMALLIREPNPLNLAASPVKFAEYVMNGLPVIMTDAIYDYAAMVRSSGNGVVLDAKKCIDEAYVAHVFSSYKQEQLFKMRNRYPDPIVHVLSKEHYVKNLRNLYTSIIDS